MNNSVNLAGLVFLSATKLAGEKIESADPASQKEVPMLGMMMDRPLLISTVLDHAERHHGDVEIVSRLSDETLHRYTNSALASRSRKLANALGRMGLKPGDRVGTLAWNDHRHLELYYGAPGVGLVCHTINPRLSPSQISYIIENATDKVLFVDLKLFPIVEEILDSIPSVETIVLLTDARNMPEARICSRLLCYEDLLADEADHLDWPVFEETTASGLCYTSGTTGRPKGVLYSHRSSVLHTLSCCTLDVFGFSARDVLCPVVPMFHVNAWGVPFAAAMTGAKLVLPGPLLDPQNLYELIERESVTFTAGVPTVWQNLLQWMDNAGHQFRSLKRVAIGGSAVTSSMIENFSRKGVEVRHAWGMTETSPVALVSTPLARHSAMPHEEKVKLLSRQGRPPYGVDFRIVAENGTQVQGGVGTLQVRGFWVASGYFNDPITPAHADDWFDTGDVAVVDADGYVLIVDRNKDLIKSGGEWISSIDLENIAQAHPAIAEAAVVARPDPRWGERPVLVVVLRPGAHFSKDDMTELYSDRVARWSIPDRVIEVDELPHTATGKVLKAQLREHVSAILANGN